jgi:hypothetical protein
VDDFWKFSPGILLLLEALKAVEGVIFVNQFLPLPPTRHAAPRRLLYQEKLKSPTQNVYERPFVLKMVALFSFPFTVFDCHSPS